MAQYLVKWEIDIEADSPRDAAEQALKIQRDKFSEATYFETLNYADNSSDEIALSFGEKEWDY